MATVEELIVKFTGDASGMDKAASKAKLDLKSVEKEVLTLNRVLERAKASGAKDDVLDYNMKALEGKIGQYLKVRDKVRREDERAEKQARKEQGAPGGLNTGGLVKGGIAIMAIQQAVSFASPAIHKLVEDFVGLTKANRDFTRAMEESDRIQHKTLRNIGDRQRAFGRTVSMQINPDTGEQDIEAQIGTRKKEKAQFEKDMEDAKKSLKALQKEADDLDGAMRKLPFIGEGEQKAFEAAKKNAEQAQQKLNALEEAAHDAGEAIKDLEKLGPLQERRDRETRIKAFGMIENQQRQIAGVGRNPAEAFILGEMATGRNVPQGHAKRLLEQQDQLEGAQLNERFMDPYKKAGKEIDRLNRLHRQGNIDAQTYAKALEEVARQTDNMGRASERAGVEVGSAESMARIDEYVRIQQQPQALANQIDRAMSQPPTGQEDPTSKRMVEILEGIRKNTNPKGQMVMAPANLGGG